MRGTAMADGDVATIQGVLARLSGVKKRYGETVALDGLDLEVRRGKLMPIDLIIRGAKVVTPNGVVEQDLFIDNGKFIDGGSPAKETINAKGLTAFPGLTFLGRSVMFVVLMMLFVFLIRVATKRRRRRL